MKKWFDFQNAGIRQAWRAGIVSVVVLFVHKYFLKSHFPTWILLTALVCLQANFGAALRKSRQRIFGTVLGCGAAFLISYFFPEKPYLFIIILLVTLIFGFLNSARSYTYAVFFMTFALMMLYFSLYENGEHFALLRIEDVLWGAFLGSLSLLFFWPEFAQKNFINDLAETKYQLNQFFLVIIDWMQSKKNFEQVYEQKIASSEAIQTARGRLTEIFYEVGFRIVRNKIGEIFYKVEKGNFPLKEYEDLIFAENRVHYTLLTLYNALLLEYCENKQENFVIYRETLEVLHRKYEAIMSAPVLVNPFEKSSLPSQDLLTEDISLVSIKLSSFFKNLAEEIKNMEQKVSKLKFR